MPLFRTFRARRAEMKAQQQQLMPKNNTKSIFRSKNNSNSESTIAPRTGADFMIQPAITMTLSTDDELSCPLVVNQELTQHLQQLSTEQKCELARLRLVVQDLKGKHADNITEKDNIIAMTEDELEETKMELVNTILQLYQQEEMLATSEMTRYETEIALEETQKRLETTTEKLNTVSSHLIQTQHKLHEATEFGTARDLINFGKSIASSFAAF